MDGESTKFDQIDELYRRFTDENRENLLKTAQSLQKIQSENAAMLAGQPPASPSRIPSPIPDTTCPPDSTTF
jgi:hypothetical protein